ncbi:MAG: adenosylcobalamin-dependent ribonucleoside-diphosphate reductase [Anaerolineae bacterium]|jgi:ribonucleoside-diphosphate reductase alpha chain
MLKEKTIRPITDSTLDDTIPLTENARTILSKRYLRRGPDGQPVETVRGMFRRVARHIAQAEAEWGGDVAAAEEAFYELLTQLRFFPNSPTFTGAGTPLGQLAACFVLPISDDMGREESGIFQTLRDAALIQQTGGGNGFSFSKLRPRGALVASSAGRATGPVGFMQVYDMAFAEIAQGGSRRGANIAVLRVDHPDVLDFIRCKTSEDAITNFNISVGISDEFMRLAEAEGDFELVSPRDGKVWRTVKAREIFDEIVKHAHHNGEPGVLFLDAANRHNPLPHLYELEASNPCGEQFLGPYENCCLCSVNLAKHVAEIDGRPAVDWAKLQETVTLATRFLDDVVTANAYVPEVPQLKEAAHRARRIGLGIMGLGDMMYHLGIRYGSEAGQEFAAQLMEFVRYHAMQTSVELARERGPFPAIQGSVYDPQDLKWKPPQPLQPYRRDWGRPALDWAQIVAGIQACGIRNAAQTTVAPTGTIATVAGCEAYGCEPVFALAYVRHVNDNGHDLELTYASPLFEKALVAAGLDLETRERIINQVSLTGSCQDVDEVPEYVRHTFVVAQDISAQAHVRMQAALQAFVDNSISKTINFPATATEEDVAQAYFLAWKLGCKGLTVYVTGSREKVVLETQETRRRKDGQEQRQPLLFPEPKKPRPRMLRGETYRIDTPLGTTFVTVNENGGREPFEVFLHTSKAGSETAAVSEAIGRLISYILRLTSPVTPRERVKEIVRQLGGIGGGRPLGFGAQRVLSLPDGVAQVLADYLGQAPDGGNGRTEDPRQLAFKIGDLCPDCGAAALVREEGCRKCYVCGYSEC